MKTYTTKQGDMWDAVAHNELGDALHVDKLMNANLDYIDMYIFPAGIVLTLPEIQGETSDVLPPWKQAVR